MRDSNRIWPFLKILAEVWGEHPDLRFGQLVYAVVPNETMLFYIEDNEMLEAFQAFSKSEKKGGAQMKLIDLLSIITDSSHVLVEDTDGNELGYYDGRDSIPEYLNEREIESVTPMIRKWGSDIPCILITII